MVRNVLSLASLAGLGAVLFRFLRSFVPPASLPATSAQYMGQGPAELGSANVVTAVVVTFRGLDTLGEVSILFAAAAVVALLLKRTDGEPAARTPGSELLQSASAVLVPLVALFGAYIFINGHLSPGGGFPGGAVLASALMLSLLAFPDKKRGQALVHTVESVSGVVYVLLGVLGAVLAGGFLDNRVLPAGQYGSLVSAGLIPVIYILIGLKVGAELGSVLLAMNRSGGAGPASGSGEAA